MCIEKEYVEAKNKFDNLLNVANKSYEEYKAGTKSWEDYQIDQRAMWKADCELIDMEELLGWH